MSEKRCKWFKLYELLPPEIYKDEEHGWNLIDDRLKDTIDFLRELFNTPLIINNWKLNGSRKFSGFRPKTCTIGAKCSAHKQGMAADIISPKIAAFAMRKTIHLHKTSLPHPVRLEADVSWLHVDVRNDGSKDKIIEFKA
jgi:hypothetical protein